MAVELTASLRNEYSSLFDTCDIHPEKMAAVESLTENIVANRTRYENVGTPLGIPWYVVGAIHSMEASLNFRCHLHNGDPLTARTVHVPKDRPASGTPPFTWEQSAADALTLEHLKDVSDWSMPGTLFLLERYNGFGYRTKHAEVLSPYLWSGSTHYVSGKYVQDGTFDPDAVSGQIGAAVILRRLSEKGVIQFTSDGQPVVSAQQNGPGSQQLSTVMVQYSDSVSSDAAKQLQRALNGFPGIFLLADGIPGRRTSDAFLKVTGHFLRGDPRDVVVPLRAVTAIAQ